MSQSYPSKPPPLDIHYQGQAPILSPGVLDLFEASDAISVIRANRRMERACLDIIDRINKRPTTDARWLAIARTHLEIAFMALSRATNDGNQATLPEPAGSDATDPEAA